MKKIIWILFLIIFLLGSFSFWEIGLAQKEPVEIYFFYSAICPHCAEEKEFLKTLEKKYPEIEIKEYEVVYHPENKEILNKFYEKYKVPKSQQGRVPVTFTPVRYFVGFSQQIAQNIENCLKECLGQEGEISHIIKVPLFGEIDLFQLSLPTLTVVLGALDGLNPCAMWILLFLIALLVNTRSRKRMWLIGGTFLLASGIVYFLLLTAWLNLFLAISYVNLTRILIGILAIGVGIWQIKNFVTFRPGVCKVTNGKSSFQDRIRNGLKNGAEKLASASLTLAILGGIIVLAFGVNLVEFFCSAGLPAIYTQILALNPLSKFSYYSYLLLYTLVFMLDDLVILLLAIITLSKIGFTEKYNYWATLIGGLLIFTLGILLIFKPDLLMFG